MKFSSKLIAWSLMAACIISFSCEEDDSNEGVLIRVNHYMQPIKGSSEFPATERFLMQEGEEEIGSDEWKSSTTYIGGLDFEWGYTYDLLVEKRENPEGEQGIFGPIITVKRVIKKTKVTESTIFPLYLSSSETVGNITVDEALNFTLVNGMTVNCGSLCEEFAEKLAEQNEINENWPVTASFKHVNNTTIELVGVWLDN